MRSPSALFCDIHNCSKKIWLHGWWFMRIRLSLCAWLIPSVVYPMCMQCCWYTCQNKYCIFFTFDILLSFKQHSAETKEWPMISQLVGEEFTMIQPEMRLSSAATVTKIFQNQRKRNTSSLGEKISWYGNNLAQNVCDNIFQQLKFQIFMFLVFFPRVLRLR